MTQQREIKKKRKKSATSKSFKPSFSRFSSTPLFRVPREIENYFISSLFFGEKNADSVTSNQVSRPSSNDESNERLSSFKGKLILCVKKGQGRRQLRAQGQNSSGLESPTWSQNLPKYSTEEPQNSSFLGTSCFYTPIVMNALLPLYIES